MDGIGLGSFAALLTLVFLEVLWSKWRKREIYNIKESLCNLGIMVGNNLIRPLSLVWKYAIFSMIEPFQIYSLPNTGWAFLITFLVTDFAYYWYHRFSHEIPALWVMHHTHHSSPWMNLSTAVRLNWIANFVSPFFFALLILLGFSAEAVTASLALGLFYQFFLHTEAIGHLGFLEGKIFNTPSAHRVHHGSNSQYIDKNYAGALIIWDQMFGTYEPEVEKVKYGVKKGFIGHNPFAVQLNPLLQFLKSEWKREKQIDEERNFPVS